MVTVPGCMEDGPVPSSAQGVVCLGQCRPHGDWQGLHHHEHAETLSLRGFHSRAMHRW
jgi:hypothetical protein